MQPDAGTRASLPASPHPLLFPGNYDGFSVGSVNVTVIDDETEVSFGAEIYMATAGTIDEATISINDDDGVGVTVTNGEEI